MTLYRASQIEILAKGKEITTAIVGTFNETEFLVVRLSRFTSAFFQMDNETFDYTYSHTYNAVTDKTTKRKPKGF